MTTATTLRTMERLTLDNTLIHRNLMTESLHKIIKHYLHHSDADDLCGDITGWLQRNYQYYKDRPVIDKICEDIWKSCEDADKSS